MGVPFKMAQPMIPGGLLHTMYEVQAGGHYDQDKGGQWVAGEPVRVPFEGAVLPVSDKDLRREITGTVSDLSEKIYTNGHALQVGAQVYDPDSGNTYTVTQELGHNSIHPIFQSTRPSRGATANVHKNHVHICANTQKKYVFLSNTVCQSA